MAAPAAPTAPTAPTETADEAPAPKSKKKLFIIIGAVVVLLGGGAGAWFALQGGHDAKGNAEDAAPAKAPVYLPLETFTVNLADSEQYLQIDITLQMAEDGQVEVIKQNMPRVRSRLLTLLSSKHVEDLSSPEAKKKLAQEVLAQIREPFYPKGRPQKVDDALFTTFVIQ